MAAMFEDVDRSNLTTLIIQSIEDLHEKLPNLTFTELLYTVFRKANFKEKPRGVNTGWLLEIDDQDIYEAVEEAIKKERENE